MLSGLKFIPRDQLDKASEEDDNDSRTREMKRKKKDRSKKRSSRYDSSDEDDLGKIKKNSRKKKWYSSDEESVSAPESGSERDSGYDERSHKHRKREKKSHRSSSKGKAKDKSREKRSKRSDYSSGDYSQSDSELERSKTNHGRKGGERGAINLLPDKDEGSNSKNNFVRKELGLDWMLRPKENVERKTATPTDQLVEPKAEEKENPRELNPYFKNSGTGYPEEADEKNTPRDNKPLSAVVGDGGASWRLKALKRAQEQAAREGRNLNEVVEERWGSLGQLSVSLASRRAAPSRAHLNAIKHRQKGVAEDKQTVDDDHNEKISEKNSSGGSRYDVSRRHPEVKVPKVHGSLSWGKRKSQTMTSKDSGLLSAAISSINKFENDGSFMSQVTCKQNNDPVRSSYDGDILNVEPEPASLEPRQPFDNSGILFEGLSANQLAAKALQLRLKGKHEEANRLMKEVENMKAKQVAEYESSRLQKESQPRRYTTHETSVRQRKNEDDGDAHLAQKIAHNKKYSISTQADDEYDYDDGPRKKNRKKGGTDSRSSEKDNFPKRMMTQQERCKFCFENPNRPRHLVIAIANFSYLSLPHWQSIVPGHCCILTSQHESATRAVDNNVWDEIRNFKKCLIMMFMKQEMDVVFLETVMGLAQQKRHCMVEVIPLPQAMAKAAPLYFKKAIDEAEDEWSQHNAKKLIDTSEKGLRGSIPKDFPYFHVEFGLNRGFVHVIDDETNFKSNFGINVVRGMLQLPEEDMYGRTKRDSLESQKQAVASFLKDWEPFDWTKQLE